MKLPINIRNGEVIIPEQIISNCHISECLTTVKNQRGILEIHNPNRSDVIFSMDRPVCAQLYNTEYTRTEQAPQRVQEVLSRLRTDHLNDEERVNLELLCARYADVFYLEGEKLSFTNKIKHSIKTNDEIPIQRVTERVYTYQRHGFFG